MNFYEIRFPTGISLGSVGGPGFNTNIIEHDSGARHAIKRWETGRCRYDVRYGVKTVEQISLLISFYRAVGGPSGGFRYKDWMDFTSAANHRGPVDFKDQTIGAGDGSTKTFQLKKTYSIEGLSSVRNITKPVGGTVRIGINDAEQTSGWSVNTTTGIVTFTNAPAAEAEITAGFEFDVPVCFGQELDEKLPVAIITKKINSIESIPIIEIPSDSSVQEDFFYGGAWPQEGQSANISADMSLSVSLGRAITVNPTAGSLSLYLPDSTNLALGGPYFFIANAGANDVTLKTNAGATVCTITAGTAVVVILGVNASGVKTWYVL